MLTKKQSVSNFNIADYEETHTFQLAFPSMNNSLTTQEGNPVLFPPSVTISAVDRVLVPEEDTGYLEERTIAYRPGYSTIFVSEGEDLQALNENRSRSLGDIEFINGYLRVSSRQPQLLDFLRLCNKNGTNINRDKNVTVSFFEVDHEAAIQSILDNEERDLEIISFCTKGDFERVRSIARTLGINVNQSAVQIRYDLRTMAMRSEETKSTFMRALNSPSVKRKSLVLEAIDLDIIYINRMGNSINWKNGGIITTAPVGKDPVDYFVDNSFTTDGESVYEEIERNVIKIKNPVKDVAVNDDAADIAAYKADPMGTLLRLGKLSGDIEVKGPYLKYKGESYRKSDFVLYLQENKDEYNELKAKLLPKEIN